MYFTIFFRIAGSPLLDNSSFDFFFLSADKLLTFLLTICAYQFTYALARISTHLEITCSFKCFTSFLFPT